MFDVADPATLALLLGEHEDDVFASNNATAALFAALAHRNGLDEIERRRR